MGITWVNLVKYFCKCVLRVTGPEATNACQDDQSCDGLKASIDGSIHGVQDIWDATSSMENWLFLLEDVKNVLNEINQIEMLWTF